LVNLSDPAWDAPGEAIVRDNKKGDEHETVVMAVEAERERISLGVKQLAPDPLSSYLAENSRGVRVTGKLMEVDARGAVVELAEGVEGSLRASEISIDPVDDARKFLKEGENVEAMIVGVDRKRRVINLSIKAKESEEEATALQEYAADNENTRTTLGDLLKEQLDSQ